MEAAAPGDAPDLSPAIAAAMAMDERASQLQADARRAAIRFAAIACVPWFS